MNRDIKFRAWDGNRMQYEYLVAGAEYCDILSICSQEEYAKWRYNVDEWKVMQFTGLYDVNGKEIWEGDILFEENTNEYYEVQWDEVLLQYTFVYGLGKYWDTPYEHFNSNAYCELPVVGNIYENPDLLKNE